MATRDFEVLYTHQKLKKAKTWQDGCLKISSNGTKAVLFDEQGCSLEVFHIRSHKIFPGSDVECERYLISIGDEKISEGRVDNNISTSIACSKPSTYEVKWNSGSLRKRKRNGHDPFRPNLPHPQSDLNPEVQIIDSDNCNRKRTVDVQFDKVTSMNSRSNLSYPRKAREEITATNFKEQTLRRELLENSNTNTTSNVNFSSALSTSHGEMNSLHRPCPFHKSSLPTQKRNRSQLLSLFAGKDRTLPEEPRQDYFSRETIEPLHPRFSKVSESFCHEKTSTTSNLFSKATFDISLGDGDDFCDNIFPCQSPCKKENDISSTSSETSKPKTQPWQAYKNKTQGNHLNPEEYKNFEIDNVSQDYDHNNYSETNNFPATVISKQNPPSLGFNVLDDNSFDEENGKEDFYYETNHEVPVGRNFSDNKHSKSKFAIDLDDSNCEDKLTVFCKSSENNRSTIGRNTNNQNQAEYGNGNAHFLPFDDDNDDDMSLTPIQGNAFEKEQSIYQSLSSKNNFLQQNLQTFSRKQQFTSSLMLDSVDKNKSSSFGCQNNFRCARAKGTTQKSSARPQSFSGELYFPSDAECTDSVTPTRQLTIPTTFTSALDYKSVLKSALREHLNIILFELSQRYHGIRSKADINSSDESFSDGKENSKGPSCPHGPAKLRAVKKDGPNKGRHFYACSGSGTNQCKFFQWADETSMGVSTSGNKKISLTSSDSIRVFFKSKGIYFYHNCLLERRTNSVKYFAKKYSRKGSNMDHGKKAMYVVLKYRDSSSLYSKDDIWIISKSMNFEPRTTFIAKSLFYGPSSSGDLEIEPVSGYSPSNWRSGDTVHAIWACNAGTEFSCIQNLDDHVSLQQMPLLPYLLNGSPPSYTSQRTQRSSFSAPLSAGMDRNSLDLSWHIIERETKEMIELYKLNNDQASALCACARMFLSENEDNTRSRVPITLIHGVFGAGKSFLLAVVILLMVKLFEISDASDETGKRPVTWKILISSTTNVAVDRILLGLLELGFDQFVRVGSVRKIAKPVLPFSIHSVGTESQELKELQGMLKTELTSSEKAYVRKSIEMHKLGENRKRLSNVRVVGVTCAACTFASLERLKFPVLLLDECSQMTEPTSLLPMARFGCRKLVLVGDPKQLNPTIQGSEPSHEYGLEQTLFDRLIKMDFQPILLRMQYRCHPVISSISNRLFYNEQLLDGVTAEQRKPLVDFVPTLCFYNVNNGKEECSQDGSYYNTAEAKFVVVLIKSLLESNVEQNQIGVITQYKSQLTTIMNSLNSDGSTCHRERAGIQISTVDAFQGGEKDVIILSCVRTKHIGFIDCERRTNVALTRAKRHLCIVGCGKILSSNPLWSKILTICKESPQGYQFSDSYVKQWNERQPISDNSKNDDTIINAKKSQKSSKDDRNKITSKSFNKTSTQRNVLSQPENSYISSSASSCDNNSRGSNTKRSRLVEIPEIINSEPVLFSDEIISESMENDYKHKLSDNDDVVKVSDSENSHISGKDDVLSDWSDMHRGNLKSEEKPEFVEESELGVCSGLFDDDSLIDDELCNIGF